MRDRCPGCRIGLRRAGRVGAAQFVSIGAAGTLQRHVKEGDLVLCTAAVRDEGVSHHYATPADLAFPSKRLTTEVRSVLERDGIPFIEGTAWTIDAPYRETIAEARHYQEQGVVAVEMEAAALFTVAAYRSVEVSAAFVASDSLAEMTWQPRFGTSAVREGMLKLLEVAVAAITEDSPIRSKDL
ncbi:MAG: nucleoside phosphorylase [Actinobacteria bacterium]|nr:nucleoside phosphorylase [Actinomycetota bacterium]